MPSGHCARPRSENGANQQHLGMTPAPMVKQRREVQDERGEAGWQDRHGVASASVHFSWGVSAKPSMSGHPRNVRQSWAEDAKSDKMIVGRESGSAPDAGGTRAGCATSGK